MKRRVVSVLIAGILFFSNIGVTSFAAGSGLSEASGAAGEASTEGSTMTEQDQINSDVYGEEEISYFKITDFTELPEDISNQKIRVGGKLEDLELPDTLEVTVEPDYEHDERIERGLAQERERIRREELEADEASSSSSDEGDAASSSDSEDGEKIIFFDEDGTISEEAGDLSSDEDGLNEDNDDEISTLYDEVVPEPENVEDSSDSNTDNGGNDEGISSPIESGSEEHSDGNSEEATDEATEGGLISWLTHTFRNVAVAYAADIKDSKTTDEEASVELISDVEWILEPEYNYGVEEFSADREGEIYLFTPVLLIPDTYYVEDELPIITVTVTDDYYAFDKETVVDDVKIRVRADKGVFPEGARVTAKKLAAEDEAKVKEVVDEQVDADSVVKEYTFDITIKDKEGYEVQPDTEKGRVVVSFEAAEVADESLEAEVYHIIDEKEVEEEPEKTEAVALGGERAKERVLTIYDENSVLKAEKLEAEVVEIEDVKVLAAETDGFSAYKLLFKVPTKALTINVTDPVINLEEIFDSSEIGNNSGNIESVVIDSKPDENFINVDIIEFYDEGGKHKPAEINDSFKHNEITGEWFLIVKRPFVGSDDKKITVTYGGTQYTVALENVSKTGADPKNKNFPTAVSLGSNTFELLMPVNSEGQKVLYQWQKSSDSTNGIDGNWEDIPLANTPKYYYSEGAGETFKEAGHWFRCVYDGKTSLGVQVLTPKTDSRTWTDPCGSSNQCYISNGIIAYTIVNEGGTPEKKLFDLVGMDKSGKNMLQTTSGGNGWRIFSNKSSEISSVGYGAYQYLFDYMYYSFTDSNTLHIMAKPDLTNGYDCFAIGANCNIGDVSGNTAYVSLDKNDKLLSVGIVSAKSDYDAQFNVNNGIGVPSLLLEQGQHSYFKYYVGTSTDSKPYQSVSVPDESKTMEDILPAVRFAWTNVTDEVGFSMSFGDATATEIITPVTKTGNSNSLSLSSNIKNLKLTSDDSLISEAHKPELGGVYDKVEVRLRFASSTSTGKSAISSLLPKNTQSSSVQASGGSNVNNTTASYTAEYFDVNVKSHKNDDKTGTTITELDSNVVVEVAYNFDKKGDIKVYRYHEGNAIELNNSTSGDDGTYRIDKDAGKIYIYTKKFSTYAVAYKPDITYTVTFNDGTNKWTVDVKSGEKVAAPESMPTKDGVTAQFWYKGTLTSTSKPTAYDFNTPVTANMTLTAYYGTMHKVTFSGISPSVIVEVADGEKVARPTDPVKEGYTFKGWYSDKTAKTLYNFDTPVTKDITLYAGFVNGDGVDEDEDGDVNGARAARTNDTLPPVWLWVLILVSALVVFSCNLYFRAKEGKVKFSNNKTVRKVTRFFLLVGLVIVTVFKFLARKVNEKRRDLALAVSGVVVLIAAGVLIVTSLEYHRSERTYEKANKTFVQETQQLPVVTDKTETVNAENTVWWDEASVEMDTLSEEYPDVIGWIYFENEDISYPIMYSGDNTKYLSTSYNGEKAKAGAIFLDGESTPDFSDPHSLIYGHNMRDLSMFGKLRYYKTDASYYDEHQYFQIFTKDGVYRYQIFAYEEVPDSHDVFWVYGKDPEGMWDMLQDIEGGSYRQTGIEATESDHVITLATCTSKEDRRLIVSALRTDEHDNEYVASN